ncbi:hypothetical protein KP509_10G018600 [Ceratopteris richardii]|uniref:Glucose-methanol-choline oxidoreductase N-terminal domain-containing protein n=1 Tax=Ceratopteris richardii TaxID=49495 RepID=A0A8T2TWN7_CERRI|nr:hypothetical protein KP509_10G018600 [Ceratopteris richardii]
MRGRNSSMATPLRICVLCLIFCVFQWCCGEQPPNYTFVREASDVSPLREAFDYIIVGGGTAGCPLAATLSSKYRVLVLERGGVPYGNPNITRLENFPRTLADDRPDSPAQRFISTDGVISSRARVLGGSSCLNAGFYTRASPEYVARLGWNGTLVNESYPWVEAVVAHVPIVREWQSAVRSGLLEVGILPDNGETYDHIIGTKVGGSIFDNDGNRHTAADLLQYADPQNILVLIHANVHRILFRTRGMRRPRAYGVAYTDSRGSIHRAYLSRRTSRSEIILSAGALGSPQLMMLSGIGPADHLQSFNIPVLSDNSEVGAGMADNPMNAVFVPSPNPTEISLIEVVGITSFGSFIECSSGFTGNGLAANSSEVFLGIMSPQRDRSIITHNPCLGIANRYPIIEPTCITDCYYTYFYGLYYRLCRKLRSMLKGMFYTII